MCGIIGYIGMEKAAPVLLDSLKRLEYRGYDSAGIATVSGNAIHMKKDAGKIDEIHKKLNLREIPGTVGIAHTRWATHGRPTIENAHPHSDCTGKIAVVHNGIIENYIKLKEELEKNGHQFKSQTDTEVIAHLIEEDIGKGLEKAVVSALKKLKGSYALIVCYAEEPDKLIVARNFSPLVIGINENELYVASDIPAFLHRTKRIVFLHDGEYGILTRKNFTLKSLETSEEVKREEKIIEWTVEQAQKGGYRYYTLKEIHEQPDAIAETLRNGDEIQKIARKIKDIKRLCIVACGTSFHTALSVKYLFEKILKIPTNVVIASEFSESVANTISKEDTVVAISQSGETADTLSAIRIAKKKGASTICVTNVVGSTITRECNHVLYTRAGPEISIVATKTFTTQYVVLALLVHHLAEEKGIKTNLKSEIIKSPALVQRIFDCSEEKVKKIADEYYKKQHFYFVGRGNTYPTSLEGALKLKEISYIHAEGFPAGELKHGPLALIEDGTPVVVLASMDATHDKTISNLQEVKTRGAEIISVCSEADKETKKLSKHVISVPEHDPQISGLLYVIPLQLLAYYTTVKLGLDPDKPRNLAKSVTVE